MKHHFRKTIASMSGAFYIALTLMFVTSCKEDGYSLNDYWIGIGTIVSNQTGSSHYFVMDNGEVLWPSAQQSYYKPTNGQRITLNYTILSDRQGEYDHYIRVNYVQSILTKNVIELNAHNADSIGNDKIQIEDFWTTGKYLTILFGYNASGYTTHFINLVRNTTETLPNDGKVYLEFRHNARNDKPNFGKRGLVSFNLADQFPPESKEGTLIFSAYSFNNGIKSYEVKLNFEDGYPKVKSFKEINKTLLETLSSDVNSTWN